MNEQARRAMVSAANSSILKAKSASDDLTATIKAMCGALMSKTDTDDVSFTDDTDTVFMDPRDSSHDDTTIVSIQFNEDESELVVYDDTDDEPTELPDLILEARVALAEKLVKMLEA